MSRTPGHTRKTAVSVPAAAPRRSSTSSPLLCFSVRCSSRWPPMRRPRVCPARPATAPHTSLLRRSLLCPVLSSAPAHLRRMDAAPSGPTQSASRDALRTCSAPSCSAPRQCSSPVRHRRAPAAGALLAVSGYVPRVPHICRFGHARGQIRRSGRSTCFTPSSGFGTPCLPARRSPLDRRRAGRTAPRAVGPRHPRRA